MDIVYVCYNSEKWIKRCFESLLNVDYDLKKVSVFVVDNKSNDGTLNALREMKNKCKEYLNDFCIIESQKNLGFGRANNLGFKYGKEDIVCFFNIDTELYPDTLKRLENEIISSDKKVALWELRQFPYEHPKFYDVLTHETTWSSGAAFATRRNVFEKVGGFDEKIFMYGEDVDLSWRIRSFGYKLKYIPKATIKHYTYQEAGELKPTQYVNCVINNILLRYRFGNLGDILKGHYQFFKIMIKHSAFQGAKKLLLEKYIKHFLDIYHFKKQGICGDAKRKVGKFYGFDYEKNRIGGFYINEFPNEMPLVSVLVRTCSRPAILRETLISLRNQTYPNMEVVVVEDGPECARKMIEEEFSDLNVIYYAMGKNVGRSKAGNCAMKLAKGKYFNFLDDDDLFYADHVEVLVNALENTNNKAAYAFGFETPIVVESKDPYIYSVYEYKSIHKTKFHRIELCHHNYIPIQCIMFARELYENFGGLDETLDALEDWDLWVRYSLHSDFDCVEKTTSIYRVPRNRKINSKRQKELDNALTVVREKHKTYMQKISVYDIAMMYQNGKK